MMLVKYSLIFKASGVRLDAIVLNISFLDNRSVGLSNCFLNL